MYKIIYILICVIVVSVTQAQQTEKVDPNHVSTGGYGYLTTSG
jgi:hypothetical protein